MKGADVISRLVHLTALVALAAFPWSASAARAADITETCRNSPHTPDGRNSDSPDLCAAIAMPANRDTSPRIVEPARAVDQIAATADSSDFVLLGEIHDNPSHHRIRAQIILTLSVRRMADKRRLPALVFEHIRTDQSLALAGFRALDKVQRRPVADLFRALDWAHSGWPPDGLFKPLFEAALDAEWPILAGNLPRQQIRAVTMGGITAIEPSEAARLGLDVPLPEVAEADLLDELVSSHCGMMPRDAMNNMADAQRYRDAFMARRLLDAGETFGGAVLLAGNGHVRADRGVPWHLARLAPDKTILSVTFKEAAPDRADPLAYVERSADAPRTSDYVVVTPAVARPDPCHELRRRMGAPPKSPPDHNP